LNAESAEKTAAIVVVVGEAVGVAADLLGEHVGVLDASFTPGTTWPGARTARQAHPGTHYLPRF